MGTVRAGIEDEGWYFVCTFRDLDHGYEAGMENLVRYISLGINKRKESQAANTWLSKDAYIVVLSHCCSLQSHYRFNMSIFFSPVLRWTLATSPWLTMG